MPKDHNKHVEAFSEIRPSYELFSAKIEDLVRSLLASSQISTQIVESRAKTVRSFSEKLSRPGKSYKDPLNDMPDLCGCRVILYYADDISRAAALIRSEFKIVEEENAHQPDELEADRFGYLSLHLIAQLNDKREHLKEWRAFSSLKVEIQIRTVIQHAWSAVSHALQYKQETAIPSRLRRRLHRIAGIFELADEEFIAIREQRRALSEQAAEKIAEGSTDIPISSSTIEEFLKSWEGYKSALDAALEAGFRSPEVYHSEMIPDIYQLSERAGLSQISGIESSLKDPDYSVFNRMITKNWNAHPDFLMFLLLLKKYPEALNLEDFLINEWDEDRAIEVMEAVKDEGSP